MQADEYEWFGHLLKARYEYLNLSDDQARKIYNYEQDKDSYSDKHYFSQWEEWDYELTTLREILNGEQLNLYEAALTKMIREYERGLIQQDQEPTIEIPYLNDIINFYETKFLTDIFKDTFLLQFSWLRSEKYKIEYLKNEYRSFLKDWKKQILTSHFREYRSFRPNQLKASMLRHKISYLLPDYRSFKHEMDEPTKSVTQYLSTRLRHLPDELEELVVQKFKELKEFSDINFKKYYSDVQGWHITAEKLSPEEEKEYHIMTLLLLDKDKYRWYQDVPGTPDISK